MPKPDSVTTPAPDIYKRVARLEKLVDHLYGKGESFPSPLIPNSIQNNSCFLCGKDHGNQQCPRLSAISGVNS